MLRQTGVILIGQTPRPDYEAFLRLHLPNDTKILMKGALDRLALKDIEALSRLPGEEILTTLSREGEQITVAARHIHERIPKLIRELETDGVDFIIVLCTGEFPALSSHVPLLLPSRILTFNAMALVQEETVSVVIPLEEQRDQMHSRWSAAGIHSVLHVLSPFQKQQKIADLIEEIRRTKPSLIVLDCMVYNDEIKSFIRDQVNLPVIAARSLLGHVLAELTA